MNEHITKPAGDVTIDLYADEIDSEIENLYEDDEAADVWAWANEADTIDFGL